MRWCETRDDDQELEWLTDHHENWPDTDPGSFVAHNEKAKVQVFPVELFLVREQWVVITLEHSSSSEKVEQRAEWWLAQVVMIGMQQQLLQLLLIISRVSWQVLLDFYCPEIFRNKPGLISYEQNIYKLPRHYTSPGGHCLSSRLLSRLVLALWNKINPPQNMTTAVHCSNGLKSPAWPLRCSSFTLWLFEGQQIVDFLRSDKRRLQILLQCPPTYQNLRNL